MEKNHICKKCGGIAGWDSYFQSWICTRCGNEERKPVTNADRIRAMTDEELDGFLNEVQGDAYLVGFHARAESRFTPYGKRWLEWLKQEATDA